MQSILEDLGKISDFYVILISLFDTGHGVPGLIINVLWPRA